MSVLAAAGIKHVVIAASIGVTPHTMYKHYGQEVEDAKDSANAEVVKTLYQMATSGESPAATFFWLKTQAGWRELDKVEHDHRHTGIVGHVPVPLDRLSQETLDRIEADLSRALPTDASGQPD